MFPVEYRHAGSTNSAVLPASAAEANGESVFNSPSRIPAGMLIVSLAGDTLPALGGSISRTELHWRQFKDSVKV